MNFNMQTIEKEKQMIPIEIKEKKPKISPQTMKEVFYSITFAIIAMVYFNLLIVADVGMVRERLEKDIQVFAGIFLMIGIFFIEKAYRQESTERAVTGIECFVLSIHSLSILYVVKKYGFDFRTYVGASGYIFAIYCTFKAIVEYTKGRRELLQNLSDIKEIVQKEEPIKKEAIKRVKEDEEEEEIKEKTKRQPKEIAPEKKRTTAKHVAKKKTETNTNKKGKNHRTKNSNNEK